LNKKANQNHPRATNAIYRETQLVRLDMMQPTLNINNDITHPRKSYDPRRCVDSNTNLLLRYDITYMTTSCIFLYV